MHYSFDGPGIYAIQVVGEVDESCSDQLAGMTLMWTATLEDDAKPVTVLIGQQADQAALADVLDTLYQNRYPLLYVKFLGPASEVQPAE